MSVSTLHTRGYRPEPGERIEHPGWTRRWWRATWAAAKNEGFDEDSIGLVERLARECLDARDEQDLLITRARARSALRGGFGVWS